jgi:hypothetical protein
VVAVVVIIQVQANLEVLVEVLVVGQWAMEIKDQVLQDKDIQEDMALVFLHIMWLVAVVEQVVLELLPLKL